MAKVWKIIERGDYSITISSCDFTPCKTRILPNPNDSFIKKYGKHSMSLFRKCFELMAKDVLHTPEIVVLYFEDKVPNLAEEGMEVIY